MAFRAETRRNLGDIRAHPSPRDRDTADIHSGAFRLIALHSITMGLCGSSQLQRGMGEPASAVTASPMTACPAAAQEAPAAARPQQASSGFAAIPNAYESLAQLQGALRAAGLESCNLMVAIDFTASNHWSGERTFGQPLHTIDAAGADARAARLNPYQHALTLMARTLAPFDEDNYIPAVGFGDAGFKARGHVPFPFHEDGRPCAGLEEVLARYSHFATSVAMSGPTLLAPVIRAAIAEVQRARGFHVLLVIGDGVIDDKADTAKALQEACAVPLAIVFVGVGDGPWDTMEAFDDGLHAGARHQALDNFQFVDFHKVLRENPPLPAHPEQPEVAFALHALMEVPQQFQAFKQREMLY